MVRFTGGCTADGSYAYEGVFEADNAGGLYASYQAGQDTLLRFEEYSMRDSYTSWSFDGEWTLPPEGEDGYAVEEIAMRCDLGRGFFETTGALSCTMGEYGRDCTLLDGLEGAVDGVGRFGLSGSFKVTESGYQGALELSGQQRLTFDLSEAEEGCFPYTLDDVAGEHCS